MMQDDKYKPIDISDKKPMDVSDKYDPTKHLREVKFAVLDRSIGLRLQKSMFHRDRSGIQKMLDKLPWALLAYGGKVLDYIPLPLSINKWLAKAINAIAKYFHIETKEIPIKL